MSDIKNSPRERSHAMMQWLVSLAVAEHFYRIVKMPPVFELACATPQAALYPADIG